MSEQPISTRNTAAASLLTATVMPDIRNPDHCQLKSLAQLRQLPGLQRWRLFPITRLTGFWRRRIADFAAAQAAHQHVTGFSGFFDFKKR